MYSLNLRRQAENMIVYLSKRDHALYDILEKTLDEISAIGPLHMQSKKIAHLKDFGVYRVRTGRWRILFVVVENNIDIWIIDIEKDTKKDYTRWIDYIRSQY